MAENSIIGIFDDVASGIRNYSLALHRDMGGEKIDFSGFYPASMGGGRDSRRASDVRLTYKKPLVVPRGRKVYVNIIDARQMLLLLPTLLVCRWLGKEVIGIAHHTNGRRVRFLASSIFNATFPSWVFTSFVTHTRGDRLYGKPTRYRELKMDHSLEKRSQKECRKRLGIPPQEKMVLLFGYIRPYKRIEQFVELFLENTKNERLYIVGKKWYDLDVPRHNRVVVWDRFVPEDEVGLYFRAADTIAIPRTLESGVLSIAKRYKKPFLAFKEMGTQKVEHTTHQFGRYIIVGAASTLLLWGILFAFVDVLGYSGLLIGIIYTPINFLWRFWLNKEWVFRR